MILLSVERKKCYLTPKEVEAEVRTCKGWRFPLNLLILVFFFNCKMDLKVLKVKIILRKQNGKSGLEQIHFNF